LADAIEPCGSDARNTSGSAMLFASLPVRATNKAF